MATYKCPVCGYRYNEKNEETAWSELPDDWTCPVCGAEKQVFTKLDDEAD